MRRSTLRALCLSGAALFILTACSEEPAGPVATDAGAAKIVAGIETGLPLYLADSPGMDFDFQGGVTAVPAGDHYMVTFPRIIITAGTDGDTTSFDIGTPTAMVWENADGTYRFEGQMADRMTGTATDGDRIALTIGGQSVKGVWLPEYDTTLNYEMAFETIALFDPDAPDSGRLTMGAFKGRSEGTPREGGLFDVKGLVGIDRIVAEDSGDQPFSLGSAELTVDMTGVQLSRLMETTRRFQALQAEMVAEGTDETAPENAQATMTLLGEMFDAYGDAFGGSMTLNDISFSADGRTVKIGRITQGFTAGSEGAFGKGGGSMGFQGLSISPPPGPAAVIPESFGLDIRLDKVPTEAAGRIFGQFMQQMTAAGDDEAAQQQASQAMAMQMMAAFSQVGTQIKLADLSASTASSALKGSGTMTVDQAAAMGVTADYSITLRNLDAVIQALSPAPGEQMTQEMMGTLTMLGMMQGLGKAGTAEDGARTLTFDIQVTPQGQILLNGQDMSALAAAMQQ